jgi:hypothetical protein
MGTGGSRTYKESKIRVILLSSRSWSRMKAEAFDQKFDQGQEDVVDDLDLSQLSSPGCEQRRIDKNTKELQLHSYEQTHLRNFQ